MRPKGTLRALGAVALVFASTALSAPAAAQPGPLTIDVFVPDVVVPAGGTAVASLTVVPSREATVDRLQFTFDQSDLSDVTITPDTGIYECTSEGALLICVNEFFPEELPAEGISLFDIEFTAEPGAAVGATGQLVVTAEAEGVEPASHELTVTVAGPVDLVGDGELELTSAPGATLQVPFTVRNAGPEEAQVVALRMFQDLVLDPQTRHSNCVYYEQVPRRESVLCSFDVVLEPGLTYEFATPLEVAIGADAAAPRLFAVEGFWLTGAEASALEAELADGGLEGTPGSGPELALVEVGAGAPAPAPADPVPAADTNPDNNGSQATITVEGDNPSDFAAVGDRLEGDAGDTVTARVGVKNLGPATADASRAGEPVNRVHVRLPRGTSAVEVPEACFELDDAVYRCRTDELMLVGETETFEFVLRIDRVIPNARGLVEVNQPLEQGGEPFDDGNRRNDRARIVVNPTGGRGGELPNTGMSIGLVAGVGAVLTVLGGVCMVLFRRRPTRFVG